MPKDQSTISLLSPKEIWDRVDPLADDLHTNPQVKGLADLPYNLLGGSRFERLCYELLVAEGHNPRFFGRSGQSDYGVDIVVEAGEIRTVYQCKNLSVAPSWTTIRDAVTKFKTDWLSKAGLPTPKRYIYCCPHPLDARSLGEKWTHFRDEFKARTGVEIGFWDQNALNTRLRRLPDVVAGLFSPSYAEHFCDHDGWMDDPWLRVSRSEARHRPVERFLKRHYQEAIYVEEKDSEAFNDAISSSPVFAIRGQPGAGKTLIALELACGMESPRRRIYYASLEDSTDVQRLWQSARRRTNLPAIFILDDCHRDLVKTGRLLESLAPELGDSRNRLRLLLILRDLPSSGGNELDDTPDWLFQLQQEARVMDLVCSLDRTLAVAIHLRPELKGLSRKRRERLHHLTGGDLLLLDELLQDVTEPNDLERLNPDQLQNSILNRYFGGARRLPTVLRLACLSQFDLVPLADCLDRDWQPGEKALAAPLMSMLFGPPRYKFLHASLAELVTRALVTVEIPPERLTQGVIDHTSNALLGYLGHLQAVHDTGATLSFVEIMLTTRLKLLANEVEAQLKARVLADEAITIEIGANLEQYHFFHLHLMLMLLNLAKHPSKSRYEELIVERFHILFRHEANGTDGAGVATIATGIRTLAKYAPDRLENLFSVYGPQAFLQLIQANGTLFELFRVLEYATPKFRGQLLDLLTPAMALALVEKTIAAGRSIGTLHMAMRELADADPALLVRLEQAIGAEAFLHLIQANGTLFELFRVLEYATPKFREQLLDLLTPAMALALVEKTIDVGRSIGTLHMAMQELGDADQALLVRLEQAIGAEAFLHLIQANGTLFELFRVLEYATPKFRGQLLDLLTPAMALALVEKTIAAGRSIGTLHMAMQELGDADPALLVRLEQAIGAEAFLHLIQANGTLFELFRVLEYATPEFRGQLLDLLTPAMALALVEKTIAAGRSIGTLNLAMWKLNDADPALLVRLEQAIGAEAFLHLIQANGTLFELFHVLKHATPEFRGQLLDLLTPAMALALVEKTIATGRSIENFHYTLRQFRNQADHRERLESVLGINGWWRLFIGRGTLNSLFQITEAMGVEFRKELVRAAQRLSVDDWRAILNRGLFLNSCTFVNKVLDDYPASSQADFRKALADIAEGQAARATWYDLNPSVLPDETTKEGHILRSALQSRIDTLRVDELVGLDFREAVNGLAFAWREREELRPELSHRFRDILPEPGDWPRKKGEIAAMRLILVIARSDQIPLDDVVWLQEATIRHLDAAVCADCHTLPLFLLLWNLAALGYDREQALHFEGVLGDVLVNTLVNLLKQRVKPKGEQKELLAQMELAGLLSFLDPEAKPELRRILRPFTATLDRFQRKALDQTFVPAFFILTGLALLQPSEPVFTPLIRLGLLAKANEYQDIGPAIEHLRSLLSVDQDHFRG